MNSRFPTIRKHRKHLIRDSEGYICRYCLKRVYKYWWKKKGFPPSWYLYFHDRECWKRLEEVRIQIFFIEKDLKASDFLSLLNVS